jgi:hypothetical protein
MHSLRLETLPGLFAICRLPAEAPVPAWPSGLLVSITRTPDELSIVCAESAIPTGVRNHGGYRALRVEGTLDLNLVGVLAALATPLAAAGVAIFVISTFDTDYLLVERSVFGAATAALEQAGHIVTGASGRTG